MSERLKQLRSDLAVTDEQFSHFADAADDARLRAWCPRRRSPIVSTTRHNGTPTHGPAPGRGPDDHRSARTAGTSCSPTHGRALRVRTKGELGAHPCRHAEDEAIIASISRKTSKRRGTRSSARRVAATRRSSSHSSTRPPSPSSTTRCGNGRRRGCECDHGRQARGGVDPRRSSSAT